MTVIQRSVGQHGMLAFVFSFMQWVCCYIRSIIDHVINAWFLKITKISNFKDNVQGLISQNTQIHLKMRFQKVLYGFLFPALYNTRYLKERYRISKKQKSWRSQIYIKLTRSNDDDSWKHPLNYFCLKCHIWWEINNLTLCWEFIAQWAF